MMPTKPYTHYYYLDDGTIGKVQEIYLKNGKTITRRMELIMWAGHKHWSEVL